MAESQIGPIAVQGFESRLSGYSNEEVGRLGWRTVDLHALKNVQARAGGKLPKVPETLWLSPAVPEPLPDLLTPHVEALQP